MNLTQTGKILIFVNLAIALGMCVWSFGLYSGRIDWSNNPAKGTQPAGELTKRIAALRQVDGALQTAETRQREASSQLRKFELRVPRDAQFYKQQLALLDSGINDQNPGQMVEYKDGEVQTRADGLVNMNPAPDLRSLDELTKERNQTQADLLASITEYQKLVQQDIELRERIIGDKGLRQQLFNEEEIKQARIKQEIEDLKPLYINVMVELQLLAKRHNALQARIKEFETKADNKQEGNKE
jgi:hypothetical protein